MLIFPSCYNPPVSYLLDFLRSTGSLSIDVAEHFIKQSVRNRCHILGPNGIQTLVVPVVHDDRTHSPVSGIRIANEIPWQKQHWRSICTAYNRSPYFEFYRDDFEIIYCGMTHHLLKDLNMELTRLILRLLKLDVRIAVVDQWTGPSSDDDPRVKYSSGTPFPGILPYPQVFSYKYGFTDGLSILDLLFNNGPDTVSHLMAHADAG